MIRIMTILLGLSLVAFIGYLFFSGNIALAIIILMASSIFLPLAIMAIKNKLYFGSVSHDTTQLHGSGGSSGGVGPSGCGEGGY